MEAKGRAAETAHRNAAWSAWQTASLTAFAFHAPKKMPSLESLTGQSTKRRQQSVPEIEVALKAWLLAKT